VAFLESRLLSSQSEQFKNYSKSSDWLQKVCPPKKPLLFWSCKQANDHFNRGRFSIEAFSSQSKVIKKLSKWKKRKNIGWQKASIESGHD